MKLRICDARDRLVEALTALEDPEAHCRKNGYSHVPDHINAMAYAAGAAKILIEIALHNIGEPIDPFRRRDAGPYVRKTPRVRAGHATSKT